VYLEEDQRAALPAVLRAWLEFALTQRGVDRRWVDPVLDAVDAGMEGYEDAFYEFEELHGR
jgi:hypothetical protein